MKEKLFRWVVKHRKPIIAFYAVAALVCLFLRQFVGVNYDITSYLPDEAASTVALNTMGDEFEGDIPNCRVMVPNVSIAQALKYKDKIKKVDGVEEVYGLTTRQISISRLPRKTKTPLRPITKRTTPCLR